MSGTKATAYIHGSSDEREAERLEVQARFVWPKVARHFHPKPGERVLDLATGVGAMAGQLHRAHPDVRLFGVDLRLSQLRFAHRAHPEAQYANANGAQLPFRDGTFDRVHCSWLLEHVSPDVAQRIVREARRVLRPGGTAHFIEVDNSTFRISPEDPDVSWAMDTLNHAQVEGGGDPFVGKKLGAYLKDAGFSRVELTPSGLHGSLADLPGLLSMVEEFAGIFESLDEALGPELHPRVQQAVKRLRALPEQKDAEFHYEGMIAIATV